MTTSQPSSCLSLLSPLCTGELYNWLPITSLLPGAGTGAGGVETPHSSFWFPQNRSVHQTGTGRGGEVGRVYTPDWWGDITQNYTQTGQDVGLIIIVISLISECSQCFVLIALSLRCSLQSQCQVLAGSSPGALADQHQPGRFAVRRCENNFSLSEIQTFKTAPWLSRSVAVYL